MEDPLASSGRPAPAASGELQRTPFAHLLVYAAERRLTGTLEFTHPEGHTAQLAVVGGHVNKVRTSEPIVHLGRVLLELGAISQETHDATLATLAALASQGQPALHGQVLLAHGAIHHSQLVAALETQVARKLAHLFTYPPETTFAFYDRFDALRGYGGNEALSVDLLPVIWRGICLAPPWEHVDAALGRVAAARLRAKPTAELERFNFEVDVIGVVSVFRDHPVLVSHFTAGGTLSASAAQLLLYCLIITRQVDVVEAQNIPLAQPAPPPPSPAAPPLAAPIRIEPASQSRIGIGGMRGPASGQFAVTRLVTDAAPQVRVTEGSVAMAMPIDVSARRQEILETSAKIEKMNYFEMLGVSEDSPTTGVEMAFMGLAKKWHPDRLPTTLADVRAECTHVFGRLSEAHRALRDPEARAEYLTLLRDGGATPEAQAYISRVVEAASAFSKAEVCLKRGDYAQAETLARQAHGGDDTQADYLALIAWLESMRPENQNAAASYERIAMLDRALLLNSKCERAHYYRGMLHKKVGSTPLAVEDFRRVAELNPKNVDAIRELRLSETRRASVSGMAAVRAAPSAPGTTPVGPVPGSKLSGLFGKLLKKD